MQHECVYILVIYKPLMHSMPLMHDIQTLKTLVISGFNAGYLQMYDLTYVLMKDYILLL